MERTEALLLLPLMRTHVSEARSLPTLRDPFDRLIAERPSLSACP